MKDSKNEMLSVKLTEDPSEGQGRIIWNGNYGKYWAHHFRTQVMARSRSTTLDPTSLIKLGELLLKCTGYTGTEKNPSPKRCGECVVLIGVDGDAL